MTRRKSYQRGNVQPNPLRSGEWSLRYREYNHVTGKWTTKRVKLGKFKDKKAARRAADQTMIEINERNNNEALTQPTEMSFEEFVSSGWLSYRQRAKHQPATIESQNSLTKNHLLPHFGKMKLRDVQPSDVSRFLQAKSDEGFAGNTLQNLYGLLRLMFDVAEQFDLIDKSPVRSKIHKPEMEKVTKPTLTAKQIQAVIARLPGETERVFALLVALTGMRLGEALALRWMDFNADECLLSIHHTLHRFKLKKPKTQASFGTVRLDPRISAMLVTHRQHSAFRSDRDFIFSRPCGRPLNQSALRNHLYKAMDTVGIEREPGKHGYHIFRHSAGTLLYDKSRDLKLVQGTLRHGDISTTSDIYVHLNDAILSEGTSMLADEILANCDLIVTQQSKLVS